MADATTLPYTCNACLVAFRSSEAQRDHMRRDWHLYNVKRRVASLPPVSQETFTEKVLTAKASSSAAAAKASFEKTCVACQKTFYSENSYQNHVKSSKHKHREALVNRRGGAGATADDTSSVMSSTFSLGEPINRTRSNSGAATATEVITKKLQTTKIDEQDEEEDEDDEAMGDDEEEDEFSTARCLFCSERSTDLKSNVIHMFKSHGMFIPEKDYLVDLEGLIRYLHAKITQNNECLYCHVIRNTASGIRTHMRDKGHCMIGFDSEEEQIEIGQFYDFTSTYSDDDEDEDGDIDMKNRESRRDGGVKLTSSEDDEEDGWETDDSSATSVASGDYEKPYRGSQPLYQTDYELHLPSGRSVGHRSLARYYRQNLHNYPTPEERQARQLAIENGTAEDEDMESTSTATNRNHHRALITRANGGLGMFGATESQKHAALASERREQTRAQRSERKFTAKVNRMANNQKHFRDPLLQ